MLQQLLALECWDGIRGLDDSKRRVQVLGLNGGSQSCFRHRHLDCSLDRIGVLFHVFDLSPLDPGLGFGGVELDDGWKRLWPAELVLDVHIQLEILGQHLHVWLSDNGVRGIRDSVDCLLQLRIVDGKLHTCPFGSQRGESRGGGFGLSLSSSELWLHCRGCSQARLESRRSQLLCRDSVNGQKLPQTILHHIR